MITPSLRRLAAPHFSEERDKCSVKDRYKKDQHRHREDRHHATRTPADLVEQNRAREQKADKHRSAIAHKDRCRIEIENQKSDQCTDQGRGQQELVGKAVRGEIECEREARDRRYSGREAVHIIEQIDRVCNPDHPKDRDPDIDDLVAREREFEPRYDQNPGPDELPDQLLIRPDIEQIVDEADEKEERARTEYDERFTSWRHKRKIRNGRSDKDANPAKHRRRTLMPAIGLRLSNIPKPMRESTHAKRTNHRENHRGRPDKHWIGSKFFHQSRTDHPVCSSPRRPKL